MLDDLRSKIRALIEDNGEVGVEVFRYTNSNIFTLSEPNITEVTQTLVNGNTLGSGEDSTYNETTHKATVTGVDYSSGDTTEFTYTFNKYSDTELNQFIKASLVWLNIYHFSDDNFEYDSDADEIFPDMTGKDMDMVAIIASILIKPDYTSYKLPNLSVTYPDDVNKMDKIQDFISGVKTGVGAVGVIVWGNNLDC